MSIIEQLLRTVVGMNPTKAPDPLIGKPGTVSRPLSRVDGPIKVAGKARFAAEVPFGKHRSSSKAGIARGRIASIDTIVAEAAVGRLIVMTHERPGVELAA
jgi:xanthine dehydrogenase YagR molybdenum-binding subunit